MDDFLRDINYEIFIKYVYQCVNCSFYKQDEYGITMVDENRHCSFYFTYDKVIEFKIDDGETYYLHFEFISLYEALRLYHDFISYLNDDICVRVLLCCSSACTSSYLADRLTCCTDKSKIDIQACNINRMSDIYEQYDLILLAPQIHYRKREFMHLKNVVTIPTNIYATYDCDKMLDFIKKTATSVLG